MAINDPVMEGTAGFRPAAGTSGIARTHASGEVVEANPSAQFSVEVLAVTDVLVDDAENTVGGEACVVGVSVVRLQVPLRASP